MVLLLGAPPAVTPHAVSGRGQCRLLWGDDLCFENTGDDEFSSAGAGSWRTVRLLDR